MYDLDNVPDRMYDLDNVPDKEIFFLTFDPYHSTIRGSHTMGTHTVCQGHCLTPILTLEHNGTHSLGHTDCRGHCLAPILTLEHNGNHR